MLERLDEYIASKKESSISSYGIKKRFKGFIGQEMDEIKERQKLLEGFVKSLDKDERIQLKQEMKEAKYQKYLESKKVDASFDIARK